MTKQPARLILASSSPRRAQLLREAGYRFEINPPDHDEPLLDRITLSPPQHAEALSFYKAASVAGSVSEGVIIGADTIVSCAGQIYGKPADADDARRILTALAGRLQDVITGVTLIDAATQRRLIRHDLTRIVMRRLTDAELGAYIDSGAWVGKAGAYGIQDVADEFVATIEGSFSNVVGLPLELLSEMLAEMMHGEPR
jgi:septum formation protein